MNNKQEKLFFNEPKMRSGIVKKTWQRGIRLIAILLVLGCESGNEESSGNNSANDAGVDSDSSKEDSLDDETVEPWPLFEAEPVELDPTSQDLIFDAYHKNEITLEEFYLRSVQAAFNENELPDQYRGAAPIEVGGYGVSPLLSAVAEQLESFSASTREQLRPYVLSPRDPLSYWYKEGSLSLAEAEGAALGVADGGPSQALVPYVMNKHPSGKEYFIDLEDAADLPTGITIQNALIQAGNKYKASGFPEPTEWVLVFPKTSPVDGNAKPIDGATYLATVDGKKRCNIIIKKNQDDDGLKATAAHELFHCVQLHYPLRTFPNDAWLYESTAVWAEEFVYPAGNTEHGYDNLIFPTFDKYFFDVSNNRNYGGYLFWFYLYQNAGKHHGPIRKALEDAKALGTQKKALEARSNFKQEHKDYALWNINSEPYVYYQDVGGMPIMAPLPPGLHQETIIADLDTPQRLDLEPGGINYYAYTIDNRVDKLKVDLRQANNKVFSDIGIQMIYKVDDNWLYLDVSNEDEVVFCRRRPSERVKLLLLVFNNPGLDDMMIGEFVLDGTEACTPAWSGYVSIRWSDSGSRSDLPNLSGDPAFGMWSENGVLTMRDILFYDRENDEYMIKKTFYSYSHREWQSISYSRECGLLYESDSSQLQGSGSKAWDIDEAFPFMSHAPDRFDSPEDGAGIYTLNIGPAAGVFSSRSESVTERNSCPFEGISTPAPPERVVDVWEDTYDSEEEGYLAEPDPNIDDIRVELSEDGKRLTGVGEANFVYGGRVVPVSVDIDYSYN